VTSKLIDLGTAPATNGHVPVPTREVAIIGYAEETRDLVHHMHDGVEIWGINAAHYFIKRKAHYWFQLHPRNWATGGDSPTGFFGRPKEHMDFLRAFDGVVWMQEADPDIPNSRRYPLAEVSEAFGREYLTSTFAYQLALALWEHHNGKPLKSLYMFGVNLSALEEYVGQRPCAEYWLGRLEQAGVAVNIPPGASLLKGPLYPRKGDDMGALAVKRLAHRRDKYMASWANANTALSMQTDLMAFTKFLNAVAKESPDAISKDAQDKIQGWTNKRHDQYEDMANQFVADMNGNLGAIKELEHWTVMFGTLDFKAPSMPLLRQPSEKLIDDFTIPDGARI
jgi:hypothetical protein